MSTEITIDTYNHYKECHVFFYNYVDSKLRFLIKKSKSEDKYSEFSSIILPTDFISLITMSRMFADDLRGVFTNKNFKLISEKINLKKEHLSVPKPWYLFHNDPVIVEWLKKLTTNLIQYDSLPGKIIYFYEFPNIDLNFLNSNLIELEIDYEFFYYEYENHELLKSETYNMIHNLNFKEHIENSIKILNDKNLCNRYIVLSCDSDSNNFLSFLKFSIFYSLYRRNNENWCHHFRNEFSPDHELLSKTNCIMIPGSVMHIYECIDEITELKNKVIKIIEEYKSIKLLGICFGHQFINYCHGSEIRRMNQCITYSQDIYIDDEFFEYEFMKKSKIEKKKYFTVNKYHIDEVVNIPDGFKHLGKSDKCKNEIFLSNDMRIFTMQGHPEYNKELIFYICNYKHLSDSDESVYEYLWKNCTELLKNDNLDLRSVCHNFIKY